MKKLFLFMAFMSFIHLNAGDFFLENEQLILDVSEDKVYIEKENISIEDNEFIISDHYGNGFKVRELFSDRMGLYTTFPSIFKHENNKVWNIVYCNTCKAHRSINIKGKCNICGKSPSE